MMSQKGTRTKSPFFAKWNARVFAMLTPQNNILKVNEFAFNPMLATKYEIYITQAHHCFYKKIQLFAGNGIAIELFKSVFSYLKFATNHGLPFRVISLFCKTISLHALSFSNICLYNIEYAFSKRQYSTNNPLYVGEPSKWTKSVGSAANGKSVNSAGKIDTYGCQDELSFKRSIINRSDNGNWKYKQIIRDACSCLCNRLAIQKWIVSFN